MENTTDSRFDSIWQRDNHVLSNETRRDTHNLMNSGVQGEKHLYDPRSTGNAGGVVNTHPDSGIDNVEWRLNVNKSDTYKYGLGVITYLTSTTNPSDIANR